MITTFGDIMRMSRYVFIKLNTSRLRSTARFADCHQPCFSRPYETFPDHTSNKEPIRSLLLTGSIAKTYITNLSRFHNIRILTATCLDGPIDLRWPKKSEVALHQINSAIRQIVDGSIHLQREKELLWAEIYSTVVKPLLKRTESITNAGKNQMTNAELGTRNMGSPPKSATTYYETLTIPKKDKHWHEQQSWTLIITLSFCDRSKWIRSYQSRNGKTSTQCKLMKQQPSLWVLRIPSKIVFFTQ